MPIKGEIKRFILDGLGLSTVEPEVFETETLEKEVTDRYSYLGTPVISNLEIPAGRYFTNEDKLVDFEGIRIDSILFDVNIEKNIVSTPINGRNGTVKQYISMGDYVCNCQGVIIGQTDASNAGFDVSSTNAIPEAEIRKLNKILRVPQSIEVVSEFLDFFDISTVVVLDCRFTQREGFRDSVYFNLTLLSDEPIELRNA